MALGSETNKRPGDDGWYPQIIFESQIQGPRNRSAEEDIVPTPYYDTRSMPKFRVNPASSDTEGLDDEIPNKMASGAGYQPETYQGGQSSKAAKGTFNPPKTLFGGQATQNPVKDRSK